MTPRHEETPDAGGRVGGLIPSAVGRLDVSQDTDFDGPAAGPVAIAPAHPGVSEVDAMKAAQAADIRTLARALDPGAFQGDHGLDGFVCPKCGRWSAEIIDPWRWCCREGCPSFGPSTTTSRHRTRIELRDLVAHNYEATVRLLSMTGSGAP